MFNLNAQHGHATGIAFGKQLDNFAHSGPPISNQSYVGAFTIMVLAVVFGVIYLFGNKEK